MKSKNIKYKLSGIIILVLIGLVILGCVLVNFLYLNKPDIKKATWVDLEILETDIEVIQEVKSNLIENENYKALVPVEMPSNFQVEPSGKSNPFDINIDEQG